MDEAQVTRICDHVAITLAEEREAACKSLMAELKKRHEDVIRKLTAELQDAGLKASSDACAVVIDEVTLVDGENNAAGNLANGDADKERKPSKEVQLEKMSPASIDKTPGTPGEFSKQGSGTSEEKKLSRSASSGAKKGGRKGNVLSLSEEQLPDGHCIANMVHDNRFDIAISVAILLSIVMIAVEVQFSGHDVGVDIGFKGWSNNYAESAPGFETFLIVVDWIFGLIFTAEIVLKLIGLKKAFWKQFTNWLDFFIVAYWVLETIVTLAGGDISMAFNPLILRVVRLTKLLRLLRLVRTIESFDSLFLLTESIKASASVCFWSTVLLGMIQMAVGVFLNQILKDYVEDPSVDEAKRHRVFSYFGTFTRTMVSMFELTLGNYAPICSMLQDISEWYALLIIIYKIVVGFAAIRIISGVFMHETFRVANSNDHIMVLQKQRKMDETGDKMRRLFAAADSSGDGSVTIDEFMTVFSSSTVKTWMAAQELEISDPAKFFLEIAGDDDTITAEEMIKGVGRLKGAAKSMDLVHLMRDFRKIGENVDRLEIKLDTCNEKVENKLRAPEWAYQGAVAC